MPSRVRRLLERYLPASWRARYERWMNQRIPPAREIALDQKNLFIFLSPQGLAWMVLVILLWIGATNYQNNLVMALCFLLLSILFVAIHLTFANMSGLRLRFIAAEPVFAGEMANFRFELRSTSFHQQLALGWPDGEATTVSVQPDQAMPCDVPLRAPRRGLFQPGRIRLQTEYPFGIVRCWTWLNLCAEVLVYPAPLETDYRDAIRGEGDDQGQMVAGSDDYFALRNYVAGDSPSRVAWKQYAAGRGLFVREYVDYRGSEVFLDYYTLQDADPEARLSRLCYCTLALATSKRPFGVRLPHVRIEPDFGEEHARRILRALAECPV